MTSRLRARPPLKHQLWPPPSLPAIAAGPHSLADLDFQAGLFQWAVYVNTA
jgi:hypothetical protein